jgi:hypothetical protein
MYAKDQDPPTDGSFLELIGAVLADTSSRMELRAEAVESLLAVKIVPPQNFDSAKLAAGIGQVAVDAYHQELATALQIGRKIYPDGMKYYFGLVDKALAELDKAASSPKIQELQTALTELSGSRSASAG